MKFEIYGASDDLIEVRVDGKNKDEFNRNVGDDSVYSGSLLVSSIGGANAVRVHAVYDECWSFSIGQVSEGRSLPQWTFRLEQEHAYSTRIIIDTHGETATVKQEQP